MSQLQIINENGKLYADSRQVAEMIGKRHADLIRSIDGYVEVLSQNAKLRSDNFFVKSSYQAGTGKTYPCYKLTRKGCDMVANKLTGEKGILFTAEYVTRFEEMKEQLTSKPLLPDFSNPIEMARAWADEMEAKQKALAQIEQDKPKVEFAEAIQASRDCISISTMASLLKQNGHNTGRDRLFKWLREKGYLIKDKRIDDYNKSTQKAKNLGVLEVNTTVINTQFGTRIHHTPLVTPKGQEYFLKNFKSA